MAARFLLRRRAIQLAYSVKSIYTDVRRDSNGITTPSQASLIRVLDLYSVRQTDA